MVMAAYDVTIRRGAPRHNSPTKSRTRSPSMGAHQAPLVPKKTTGMRARGRRGRAPAL